MLRKLSTRSFRNLDPTPMTFDSGLTLVYGANGHGKTNLLEAFAVLGNLRSFRGAAVRRMATHGTSSFFLEGEVKTPRGTVFLSQRVEVGPPVRRTLSLNGAVVSLEQYLVVLPVFILSRADTDLVDGPPERRRALMDRLAFFMDERHLRDLNRYRTCVRQRNAALSTACSDHEIEVWDRTMAEAGARVVQRRRAAIDHWRRRFQEYYDALRGLAFPDVEAEYRGESWLPDRIDKEVAEMYRQRYHETRARDRRAGFTLEGPHRHDLLLKTGGRSVRDVLSAGQVKTTAAAVCMATLAEVEERKGETLPVLVDDADAEIDEHVLAHLVNVLGGDRQVVMSSAHGEFLSQAVSRGSVVTMVNGRVEISRRPHEVET